MLTLVTLVSVLLLASVHIWIGKLTFLDRNLSFWKSLSGGIGISYTVIALLPKINLAETILEEESTSLGFVVRPGYVFMLAGLIFYYGIEIAIERAKDSEKSSYVGFGKRQLKTLHALAIAGYYFLISYLVVEAYNPKSNGVLPLLTFTIAMIVHYVSLDHSLRHKYSDFYDQCLRWVFAASTLLGWLAAVLTVATRVQLAYLFSFCVGGLLVFSLTEKVPGRDRLRFRPFALGAIVYTVFLIIGDELH